MIALGGSRRGLLLACAAIAALASCRGGGRQEPEPPIEASGPRARDVGLVEQAGFGRPGPTGQGGATLQWVESAMVTAESGSPVAVADGVVVVGHPNTQAAVTAHFYAGGAWTTERLAIAARGQPTGALGFSVAVSGGPSTQPVTVVAGAPTYAVGSNAAQGAAYAYVREATTWLTQGELVASDGLAGDRFGSSVAISGGLAVIGAPAKTIGANAQQGAAYVFAQSGGAWTQQGPALVAMDGAASDSFGMSVSISGTTVVVGAPGKASGTNWGQGAAYVFVQSGQAWSFQQKLEPSDGATSDAFGSSVSIDGETILLGSPGKRVLAKAGQGAAYMFTRSADGWTQLPPTLIATDGAYGAAFGGSVALSGDVALIGSSGADQGLLVGASYAFGTSTGAWAQEQKLSAPGWIVAVSGDLAAARGTYSVYLEVFGPRNGTPCADASSCASGNCVAGICCDAASPCSDPCQSCASGSCTTLKKTSSGTCGLYACNGTATTCPTTCSGDADCAANAYCDPDGHCAARRNGSSPCSTAEQCLSGNCFGGICMGTAELGAPCGFDTDCASNTCVDLVCCDGPCEGQCEACDVDGYAGRCSPVSGPARGLKNDPPRAPCAGAGTPCEGTCDGASNTAACAYPTTACGSVCEGARQTESTCNGQGRCVPGSPHSCNNFVCADGATCKTACATVADCIAGFSCQGDTCRPGGATCADGETSQSVIDGRITRCAPFLCDPGTGACRDQCSTVSDCVGPNVCDPVHNRCVAPPSTTGRFAAAGCRAAGSPRETPGVGALLMLLSAAVVRCLRRRSARACG